MADFTRIKAFAFDVDGVVTDGGILCDLEGNLIRTYDAKDGFAIRMAVMNGYPVAVITGGRSGSIRQRFIASGVSPEDVYLGSRDKIHDFNDFCTRYGLDASEVMFFGDDIPDIAVIEACGCGVCPADAVEEVRDAADFVSPYPGGKGCLRHAMESVMKSQDRWHYDVQTYKKLF